MAESCGLRAAVFVRENKGADLDDPPDILITNHVMLERIVTCRRYRSLRGIKSLVALVLDELHTFRGNTGADVGWLVRRLQASTGTDFVRIGASATLKAFGGYIGGGPEDLQSFLHDSTSKPLVRPVRLEKV
jgi:ATP-dependent helicase YprA (DUF1998 family)